MKLSRKWLAEFVSVDANDKQYADAMTLSGSKVELTEVPGEHIQNVVVGRVNSLERHPNSDHLWVCQIDVGGKAVQIVTGAQNVAQGDLVPVARDGANLPGDIVIRTGELRGIASEGMLCSLKELGLTTHDYPHAIEDGIFILQGDERADGAAIQPGDDICAVLGLDDHVVEFEITPNRPDCLSVIGLARETAATFQQPLRLHTPVVKGAGGEASKLLQVEIADPDLCPRYTARMVKNVKIGPSPAWLRERLRNSGVRPINNIVDITNYVMLEYGQPMHAFDFSCVGGSKIVVRRARDGETMETLDGVKRTLTPGMLVIADESRPVGVAGVMGGANSEIVGDTAAVVFESANFSGVSIRQTALALGMRTDASSRFEKGLDPMGTLPALQRACELVELLGCGEVVDGVIDAVGRPFSPTVLALEPEKINRLLGTDIPPADMEQILSRLGFEGSADAIVVPSWRADVEHYSDLAEEVARFFGYDNIPATLVRGETTRGGLTDAQRARAELGALCRSMGYSEIMTYSFTSPAVFDKLRLPQNAPERSFIPILNPLGEDTGVMRTTALPSMLEALGRNVSHRTACARLYELATIYRPVAGQTLADERPMLSLGAYGSNVDFFALKGVLEAILSALNVPAPQFEARTDLPYCHPGRCAEVLIAGQSVGLLAQVHPLVAEEFGIDAPVYTAQIDFLQLLTLRAPERQYQPLPRHPAAERDIALVCDAAVTIGQLDACIRRGGQGLLREVKLFDIYTGAPIPAGKKSVAFALKLRADDRTLTDADADAEVGAILDLLGRELGATLR